MPTEPSEIVERFVESLLAGDFDAMREAFAEDATWLVTGSLAASGTKNGLDEIMGFFRGGAELFEEGSFTLEVTNRISQGNQVALECHAEGRGRKSGLPYDNYYVIVFEVSGERIKAVREYFDTQHVESVIPG